MAILSDKTTVTATTTYSEATASDRPCGYIVGDSLVLRGVLSSTVFCGTPSSGLEALQAARVTYVKPLGSQQVQTCTPTLKSEVEAAAASQTKQTART